GKEWHQRNIGTTLRHNLYPTKVRYGTQHQVPNVGLLLPILASRSARKNVDETHGTMHKTHRRGLTATNIERPIPSITLPHTTMTPCHYKEDLDAQINEFKELYNGIHHHKTPVIRNSSCHNHLFRD